jgi:hypothetical protein
MRLWSDARESYFIKDITYFSPYIIICYKKSAGRQKKTISQTTFYDRPRKALFDVSGNQSIFTPMPSNHRDSKFPE